MDTLEVMRAYIEESEVVMSELLLQYDDLTKEQIQELLEWSGDDEYVSADDIIAEREERKLKHEVEITIEKVFRRSFVRKLNDKDYEALVNGDGTPLHESGLLDNVVSAPTRDCRYVIYDCDLRKFVTEEITYEGECG